MTDPLLRIENMDVSYIDGDSFRRVVKGVSLDIRRKEVLGIVGQSGSGKSTLIKAVLRILPPPGVITGGRALYKGMDLLVVQMLDPPPHALLVPRRARVVSVF